MKNKHLSIRQVELIHINKGTARILKKTRAIHLALMRYLSPIVLKYWEDLEPLNTKERLSFMEKLIHQTKENPSPAYGDFDKIFYKLPSDIRRSAINAVTGAVSSYKTRLADYESRRHKAISNGKRFREKPPVFTAPAKCLTLYKNVFEADGPAVRIKVFIRNTWDWITVRMARRDWKDFSEASALAKAVGNPSVVPKNHKFYLMFPIAYPCEGFPDTPFEEQVVLGVDLGLNHSAVCSVVDAKGRIHGRYFDPFHKEMAAINRLLDRIRYKQRKSGNDQSLSALYTKLAGVKENYVKQLAHWIVGIARKHHVYGIVLEHLGRMKGRGRKKARIHHWCKCRIRDYIKGLCFRYGIRVFQINPRNTSALAFDGSGKVTRDKNNFSQCTFASGKQYHCDLNASYNIAARYFLRAAEKSMSFEAWEQVLAKVPELAKRTNCTLSTLWKLSATPEDLPAAA